MTGDRQLEDDLRTTEDTIAQDAETLADVEDEKRRTDPRDPRMTHLTEKAVDLASRVRRAAVAERDLTEAIQDEPGQREPD